MGVVWRARDEVLKREVAVKEVRAPGGIPPEDVERMYARLENEAWAAARISHTSVITVYDVVTEDGRPWIVMELVRGLSLSDVLDAEGPMPARRAAQVGAEVLAALRAAHAADVLHRDVKPGNVLLANDGRVVLTDFGIARLEGASHLTVTGELVGSPEFVAPELAIGRTPTPASDLWSLGVLLYAAVEGHSPFRQDTPWSTLRAVVEDELPPPSRAGALTPVIEGLLRKEPAERLSAADAERALRSVATGGAPPPGPGLDAESDPHRRPTVTTPSPVPPPPPGPGSHTQPGSSDSHPNPAPDPAPDPPRPRRALLLIAGLAALVLALGGLTYALMDGGGGGGGSGNGGGSNGGSSTGGDGSGGGGDSGGSDGGGDSGGTDGGSGGNGGDTGGTNNGASNGTTQGGDTGSGDNGGGHNGGGDTGGDGGPTTHPPHTVEVSVTATNDSYSGPCPPPAAQAPSFTASFTVGRTPVTVEYRWLTKTGQPTNPGWKTLQFADGGDKTQQVNHTELGHDPDGTLDNEISVEVRDPVTEKSNAVAYSVTCEQEPPTSGGSSYAPNS
ncbi:serine/threonine-protein kinase [Streptomyces apocyni]|uniref:serine/threonine-protein kinase n=1 Tax=Streptomyces apocyni TaxID=2654677 RepID=UPI0012EA12AF|nr:serine/threonine-protein kinase [Streptomyces apocyni]